MSESKRLADQLHRALNGDAWHGPAWREVLEDVSLSDALRRPIPQAHSIAEIVLHTTTWQDVARRRLEGETPKVTEEQDWPKATFTSDAEWSVTTKRLFETGKALADTVAAFPEQRLQEERPGGAGTWYQLAIGILQHELYHAGQVGLLRKAGVTATAKG
jgi:hypothetical protein